MMNKNGQVLFFTLMIGLTVLVLALGLAFPVKQSVDNARNSTQTTNITYDIGNGTIANGTIEVLGMDCSNTSISSFNKGACLVADMSLFYFIGGLIFMVGSIIAAKVLL